MARRRARRFALAASTLVSLSNCNERFDFDVPDATGGAGGPSTGGSAGSGGFAGTGGVAAGGWSGNAPCAADDDCGLASLHCDVAAASCVECLSDAHCTAVGLPRCDGATRRCVECGLDLDCSADETCEPASRSCLRRCREDIDCVDEELACDSERGVCFECVRDDECERSERGERCIPESGRCAACARDEDCAGLYCDPVIHDCVECRDGADCGPARVCDPSAHRCRAP